MQVKCLEIRDSGTFIPVICIKPIPTNPAQRWLLERDGYGPAAQQQLVIMIDAQCRGASYDPYEWPKDGTRTKMVAHDYIASNWYQLSDGDVIDVEWILGERAEPKVSERFTVPV